MELPGKEQQQVGFIQPVLVQNPEAGGEIPALGTPAGACPSPPHQSLTAKACSWISQALEAGAPRAARPELIPDLQKYLSLAQTPAASGMSGSCPWAEVPTEGFVWSRSCGSAEICSSHSDFGGILGVCVL